MTALPLPQYDAADIKARLDCRDVALALGFKVKNGRNNGKYIQGIHPNIPQRTGSFTVYADGYKDHKLHDEKGDVYGLIALLVGLDNDRDFPEILAIAAGLAGIGPSAPNLHVLPPPVAPTVQADEQGPDWQRKAESSVREAARYLWSGRRDAAQVLHYLRQVRGLSDETIKRANLGYNPTASKGRPAGITIPWTDDAGRLVGVRVRSVVGNLAQALGRPNATDKDGKELPKLLSFTGSRFSGQAYTMTGLNGRSVVIVEGEFDALIAAQALPEHDVITAGSATGITTTWADVWGPRIGSLVYLWLDNDEVGHAAQARLTAGLPRTATLYRVAAQDGLKDATDVITAGHDAGALIAQSVAIDPDAYGSLPWAGLERVLVEFCPASVPAVFRAALAVGGPFTVQDLTECGIASRTAALALTTYTGVLFVQDAAAAGRRGATYRLLPWAELSAALVDRVVLPRLIERHYRTDGDRVAPASAELLRALDADLDDLDKVTAAALPYIDIEAGQAVAAALDKVRKTFTDRTPSALSDDTNWPHNYRHAVVIQELADNGARSTTQKAIAERVAVDRRVVAAVYSERVVVTPNYRPLPVAAAQPGEKLYDIVPAVRLPREVRIDDDGTVKHVQADGKTGQAVTDPINGQAVKALPITSAAPTVGQAVVLRRHGGSPRLLTADEIQARKDKTDERAGRSLTNKAIDKHAKQPAIATGSAMPTAWDDPGHNPTFAQGWADQLLSLHGLDAYLTGVRLRAQDERQDAIQALRVAITELPDELIAVVRLTVWADYAPSRGPGAAQAVAAVNRPVVPVQAPALVIQAQAPTVADELPRLIERQASTVATRADELDDHLIGVRRQAARAGLNVFNALRAAIAALPDDLIAVVRSSAWAQYAPTGGLS